MAAEASMRATKRKLDDAFHTLDTAVTLSLDKPERPSPLKKAHSSRSLSSTLAKYGVKVNDRPKSTLGQLAAKTPNLTAILSRAASRSRKPTPFALPEVQAPQLGAEYRPSSKTSFLSRLATFKLVTYANKPAPIDAVAASKCGWVNEGKDRLVCRICNCSWVVAGREGMTRDAANALIEKQRHSLVDLHKNGCPWKTRQCDDSIYTIALQSPAVAVRDLKANASVLETVVDDIEIKHPLSPVQVTALQAVISAFRPQLAPDDETGTRSEDATSLSEAAVLISLFGWSVSAQPPRMPSRANSLRSKISSPALSRASSVVPEVQTPLRVFKADTLLECHLCQRKIGLWAFAPPSVVVDHNETTATSTPSPSRKLHRRQFDLLQEHRSYCPYVVKSSVVPSLPALPTGSSHVRSSSSSSQLNGNDHAMEGWRAFLTVIMRYGMGQRHLRLTERNLGAGQLELEDDTVGVMVKDVKSHGGRELLRYVKGLLGA